jgi:hypothetical protein
LTEKAGLKGLRFHDLRHAAITTLAESGLPDQTIMGLAGHVSQRMLGHYSHIRMNAKRAAVDVLAGEKEGDTESSEVREDRPTGKSYDTNHVTNQPSSQSGSPQLIEN